MKILLPIKRVVDYNVVVQPKQDGSGVITENAPHSMNPFDAIAVEAAIELKEQNPKTELIAVSIGSKPCQETLRQALAMGVDHAILIETDLALEPLQIATVLQQLCTEHQPDLVLCGKQSIDGDHNQTGQMLAALLDWPQGCFISSLKLKENGVSVEREIDSGLETLEITLPCVLTTDLRLNTPRFAKLPDIIKAKSKPLTALPLDQFKLNTAAPHQRILNYRAPGKREPGQTLNDIDALIKILQQHEVSP